MNRGIIIVILMLFSCCHNGKEKTKSINDKIFYELQESRTHANESLILLIHSGHFKMIIHDSDTTVLSETQIISCNATSMKYGYGSVLVESDTIKRDLDWFSDYAKIGAYEIRERNLKKDEQIFVKKTIVELSDTYYENPNIVKDDWEYILYVNYIKVASGNVSSIDSFPPTLCNIIMRLLEMASPLYPRNGYV